MDEEIIPKAYCCSTAHSAVHRWSHVNFDLCRQNDIILFCLPSHTTHALQPLDMAVIKSLKDNYSKTVRSLIFAKSSFVVTKTEFSKVIHVPF